MLLTEKDAKAITERVMSFVKADDAIVNVSSENYAHQRFAANAFTTGGKREGMNVGVTVWVDKKRGASSTTETDESALRATVEQAEQLARLSPVDREYLPTLSQQTYKPASGFSEATANVTTAERARVVDDVLKACERANVTGAGLYQTQAAAGASRTKNGNFYFERASLVSLGLTARTREGDGSGYFLRNHYDVRRLDAARVAREAIQKGLNSRNPRTIDPGVYPVILEPQAVADLLSFFAFSFDARSAEEGRSPFSAIGGKTKMGEKIFDERLNVYSDPQNAELPGSQSAQGGLPSQKIYLVRNGVLENLTYSRFWASQKGVQPTAGPVNNIMEGASGGASVDEMIRATPRGLLLSRFWYIRSVDPRTALVTGLTRDGVWFIENGRISYPVRNFRFNQSVIQMLAPGNVEMIGRPERVGSSEAQGSSAALLPALKLKAFNFTSQSEAV
ncbi:MAG: TldD/PmbA family protein [Pyrinomonadaceae bacterium]|nr:TldD/PmbA family protein [Pyrinomonadaceae bacterium]